jgi:16S rRNA (cytosine967-C5)-methyltransferase
MADSVIERGVSARLRLHPNLVRAIVEALRIIFSESKYADSVVRNLLKSNPKWGSNDRKLLAETTYEVVRWWRKLWAIYGKEVSLKDVPLWNILGIYFTISGYELPPWKEFESIKDIPVKQKLHEIENNRALRESIPDWLDVLGSKELGMQWEKEIHVLNEQAPVIIRVNTLRTSIKKLQEELQKEAIETKVVSDHPDALELNVRKNIFQTNSFKNGLFEVQDASSQEVAYFMDIIPGMRIIDACAGGGGKSLHMAALMQNKGKIIAMDVHDWKLKELQKRASRAGISIIETRVIDSAKAVKRLEKSADRLLLDVPCSGLGVLRRNPDIKWKLSVEAMDRIKAQQLEILSSYSKMLKTGGKLVYATCSILPSENEGIVDTFTGENKSFKKLAEKKILPSQSGSDGFYMAALERID